MAQVSVSLQLRPSPPENATVVHLSPTQVQLTWDASPSLPADIDSYSVFLKLKTDPTYPLVPALVIFDSLPSYSETINVSAGTAYDFKVFANANSGLSSSESCASCQTTNAICGNGTVDPSEDCDGVNLNGLSCTNFSYGSGTLSCSPTCEFVFSACHSSSPSNPNSPVNTGGGGGGGFNLIPPSSGTAVSPPSTNDPIILITYSGSGAFYPKKLKEVRLYYKKEGGQWLDSGLVSSTTSGQFKFDTSLVGGPSTYFFGLRAYDNFGAASSVPAGQGDTSTVYAPFLESDTYAPIFDSLFLSLSADGKLILISYRQARDVGSSGLKQVELWYKKGEKGKWTFSGLKSQKSIDLFSFDPSSLSGTYYFALVLEDQSGNRSEEANGEGQGNVVFAAQPFQATVNGPKNDVTDENFLTLLMGGEGISAYKYKLNHQAYSQEIPVEQELSLLNLKEGEYTLSVIGKNDEGLWQDTSSPTLYHWRVDFSRPTLSVSGPDPDQTITPKTPKQVSYLLKYADFDTLSLDPEDISLKKTGTADAVLILSQLNASTFLLTLSEISGRGTLSFSIAPNTAMHNNGRAAAALETSRLTLVNVEDLPPDEKEEELTSPSEKETEISINQQGNFYPSITPPKPEMTYNFDQIVEKAREAIALKKPLLPEQEKFSWPPVFAQAEKKLNECSRYHLGIDFESLFVDEDKDGLSNRMECYLGTALEQKDTDKDGCLDAQEVYPFFTQALSSSDCSVDETLNSIFISDPQLGWSISALKFRGIVPALTSQVHLIAFPFASGQIATDKPIRLGQINHFYALKKMPHLFFEGSSSNSHLNSGEYYLVAIGILNNGSLISSTPFPFYFDPELTVPAPKLFDSEQNPIVGKPGEVLTFKLNRAGQIEFEGKSEYGTKIFGLWQSLIDFSSTGVDSASGEFILPSSDSLNLNQLHRARVYGVQELKGKQVHSEEIEFQFMIKESRLNPLFKWRMIFLISLSFLGIFAWWRGKKN